MRNRVSLNVMGYIRNSEIDLLKMDSIDVIFESTYVKNNPKLLNDLAKLAAVTKLEPPWGDDLSVFSGHIIRNFTKILVGWLGTMHHMDFKYGMWMLTDLNLAKNVYTERIAELDMTNAVNIYCVETDGCSLFLYQELPEIVRCIDPSFRVVK